MGGLFCAEAPGHRGSYPIMFYTRPKIEPLGFDLVELHGGLGRPSQYWGRTADGRPIHIRYADGCLSVRCGAPGEKDRPNMPELCNLEIGPKHHGDMLSEQACDLLGLTVRGKALVLTEAQRLHAAEADEILDWSGRTTHWEEVLRVTRTASERFLETLGAESPGLCLLDCMWRNGRDRTFELRANLSEFEISSCDKVYIGFGPREDRLRSLLRPEKQSLSGFRNAFEHTMFYEVFYHCRAADNSDARTLEGIGTMLSSFPTDAPASAAFIGKVERAIQVSFTIQTWPDFPGQRVLRTQGWKPNAS